MVRYVVHWPHGGGASRSPEKIRATRPTIFRVEINKAPGKPVGLLVRSMNATDAPRADEPDSDGLAAGLLQQDDVVVSVNGRLARGAHATSELIIQEGDLSIMACRGVVGRVMHVTCTKTSPDQRFGIDFHSMKSGTVPWVGALTGANDLCKSLRVRDTVLLIDGGVVKTVDEAADALGRAAVGEFTVTVLRQSEGAPHWHVYAEEVV